ncbi:4-hydroxythreonine-4-phosphate dehydrogenase [Thorsellia anophelis DSM 18579]|uniref:4-hydroxythreonine-4-phosphate dehydrogenase n=2 Tax=Thorsellia anophelis TaxID=336804 RepID=A0A1I0ACU9_9GAMM|nr:4-hydroxythreonine-4-phosphate dehydrogenase [Thorsellia anophelis DSM 18579]
MLKNKPIIVTPGEPAGIGPDLVLKLAQITNDNQLVICADKYMLLQRAQLLEIPIEIIEYDKSNQSDETLDYTPLGHKTRPLQLRVLHIPLGQNVVPGQLSSLNSQYVVDTLVRATKGCLEGEFCALLTAPVHKGIINDAGITFSGHTELLAELSGAHQVVMVLATDKMKVALATTHIPLKEVSEAITFEGLSQVLKTIDTELKVKYRIKTPNIFVCGLNPHAGEGGHLGREEIDVIIPVIEKLKSEGLNLVGPMPADTVFQPKYLESADIFLAMYHDQGLPVLKYQGFGEAVNITFGLPFIRVSVDHGTALDLAGTGKANEGSILTAYNLIKKLIAY